jgi:hypothetical protein
VTLLTKIVNLQIPIKTNLARLFSLSELQGEAKWEASRSGRMIPSMLQLRNLKRQLTVDLEHHYPRDCERHIRSVDRAIPTTVVMHTTPLSNHGQTRTHLETQT